MPRSNSRVNSTNPSWLLKKMNDYRSELENLPGSFNSRIPKQEPCSTKNGGNYVTRNTITSPEVGKQDNFDLTLKKKYISENEKRCVKLIILPYI